MRFILTFIVSLLLVFCFVGSGEAKAKSPASKQPKTRSVSVDIVDKGAKKLASEKGLIDSKGIVTTRCSLVVKYLKEIETVLVIRTDDGQLLDIGKIISCNLKKDQVSFYTKPYKSAEEIKTTLPVLQDAEEKLEETFNEHDWLQKGLENLKSRNFAKAENAFKQVIRLKPDFYDAYIYIGNVYFLLSDYIEAIKSYSIALDHMPNKNALYNKIGTSYLMLGDYDRAIKAYKQAISSGQPSPQTHFHLGLLYFLIGDVEEAFKEYVSLTKTDEELAESLFDVLYR